jgi:hypothetical protein
MMQVVLTLQQQPAQLQQKVRAREPAPAWGQVLIPAWVLALEQELAVLVQAQELVVLEPEQVERVPAQVAQVPAQEQEPVQVLALEPVLAQVPELAPIPAVHVNSK